MSVLTSIPTGTFVGSAHHNVAAAVFPIGTKVEVKQDTATGVTPGFCTFIYMHHNNGSDNVTMVIKCPAQLLHGESSSVTCDQNESNLFSPGVICLTAVTDTYYGWYQCGGPVCNGNSTALATSVLDGDFVTGGNVVQGGLNYIDADVTLDACTAGTNGEYGFVFSDTANTSNAIDAEFLYIWDKF